MSKQALRKAAVTLLLLGSAYLAYRWYRSSRVIVQVTRGMQLPQPIRRLFFTNDTPFQVRVLAHPRQGSCGDTDINLERPAFGFDLEPAESRRQSTTCCIERIDFTVLQSPQQDVIMSYVPQSGEVCNHKGFTILGSSQPYAVREDELDTGGDVGFS